MGELYPDQNISDIPYNVMKKVCEGLDQRGKWRDVIAQVTDKAYRIKPAEVEKIAQASFKPSFVGHSPSMDLWAKYGDFGMTVKEMWHYLDKLKLERELILLKKPSEPIVLIKEPEQQYNFYRKKTMRIKCEAKGFPYPRYVWFHKPLTGDKVTEIEENQNGMLEIKQVRRRNAGSYQCRIHNADTLKAIKKNQDASSLYLYTRACLVTVEHEEGNPSDDEERKIPTGYLPDLPSKVPYPTSTQLQQREPQVSSLKILKQTMNDRKIVDMKESLCLFCQAEGKPPPKYQWICDDMVLEGENKSKLLIDMCWPSHAGTYWCIISNGHQEIFSKKVTVQVIDPQLHPPGQVLYIQEQPRNEKAYRHRYTQFNCQASCRTGFPHYTWFHVADGRVNQVRAGRNGRLEIRQVDLKDAGTYYCEVKAVDDSTGEEIMTVRTCDAILEVEDSNLYRSPPVDKVALLIGIENYMANTRLSAVPFDIQAAAVQFQEMNYKVITLLDLTLRELNQAIDLLCDFVEPGVYAALYVVGHGFYFGGNHYLMPYDLQHGRKRIEDCFCLEDAHRRVQEKAPEFFLMVNDMCREDGSNEDVTNSSNIPNFKPKVNGNSLIVYAASKAEKSYEPTPTNQHRPENRGAFNQHFCEALALYKDKPVVQVFNHLQDLFREKYHELYGKRYPMHPEMVHNLTQWQRTLNDRIPDPKQTGREVESEKRHQKFHFMNQLLKHPIDLSVRHQEGTVCLKMSCEKIFSNQFVLVFKLTHDPGVRNLGLKLKPQPSPITQHMEHNNTEWRFVFRDIQRLRTDFCPVLSITLGQHNSEADLMQLGDKLGSLRRPLISNCPIWESEPRTDTHVKEPTEDECHSLGEESHA